MSTSKVKVTGTKNKEVLSHPQCIVTRAVYAVRSKHRRYGRHYDVTASMTSLPLAHADGSYAGGKISACYLVEVRFYIPLNTLNTKKVILETFPKPISWLGMEKQNLTQQKHAFTNQKMYYNKRINTKN